MGGHGAEGFMKKEEERLSDLFVLLSGVAVIFAVFDAFGITIYAVSTQWLLVSVVLMLWAIFIHIKD